MTMDQTLFAAALLDPSLPVPPGVTSARGAPDTTRFAIYRNNVTVSLTKTLGQRFPVTSRLVGEVFFNGMARAFMAKVLPSSPLIFAYGDDFPDFIAGFAPASTLPYLADTARLEAQWTRAYHAADAAPIALEALAAITPERLGATRLQPHPAAAVVRSDYSIGTIWQAHQGTDVAAQTVMAPECVLITRPEIDVQVHVIAEADAIFARLLLSGESLDTAALAGFSKDSAFDFGRAIVGLLSLGAFAGLSQEK